MTPEKKKELRFALLLGFANLATVGTVLLMSFPSSGQVVPPGGNCKNCFVSDGGYYISGNGYLPIDGGTVTGSLGVQRGIYAQNLDAGAAIIVPNGSFIIAKRDGDEPAICMNNGSGILSLNGNSQFVGVKWKSAANATECQASGQAYVFSKDTGVSSDPIKFYLATRPGQIATASAPACAAGIYGASYYDTTLTCVRYCEPLLGWSCLTIP